MPNPIKVKCPQCGRKTKLMELTYIFVRPFGYGSTHFDPDQSLLELACGHQFDRSEWCLTLWTTGKARLIRKEGVG